MVLSKDFLRSLDALQTQIKAAEKLLKGIPGARDPRTRLNVDDPDGHPLVFQYFRFGGELDGNRNRLVVAWEDEAGNDGGDEIVLIEMTITEQHEFARLIPDLLDLAKANNAEVQRKVDEATEIVRNALRLHKNVQAVVDACHRNAPRKAPSGVQMGCLQQLMSGSKTRKQLSDGLDGSWVGCSVMGHIDDEKKVEPNSLLGRGMVIATKNEIDGTNLYSITPAGKKALADAETKVEK